MKPLNMEHPILREQMYLGFKSMSSVLAFCYCFLFFSHTHQCLGSSLWNSRDTLCDAESELMLASAFSLSSLQPF